MANKFNLVTTIGVRELRAFQNISFAGKTVEEIREINFQIGDLKEQMMDARAVQAGLAGDLGQLGAKALQGFAAIGQLGVGLAGIFGVSAEAGEKLQKAMVQLIGVSQAFATVEQLISDKTLVSLGIRLKSIAVMGAQKVATIAATVAQSGLNAAMLAFPVALVIAGIAALIFSLTRLIGLNNDAGKAAEARALAEKNAAESSKATADEMNQLTAEANSDYNKEVLALNFYINKLNDANVSLKEKTKLLKELKDANGDHLKGLTLQNIATAEGVKILDDFKNKLDETNKTKLVYDAQNKASKAYDESGLNVDYAGEQYKKSLELRRKIQADLDKNNAALLSASQYKPNQAIDTNDPLIQANQRLKTELSSANTLIDENYKKLEEVQKLRGEALGKLRAAKKLFEGETNNDLLVEPVDFNSPKNSTTIPKPKDDPLSFTEEINANIKKLEEQRESLFFSGQAIGEVSKKIFDLKARLTEYSDAIKATDKAFIIDTSIDADVAKDVEQITDEFDEYIRSNAPEPIEIEFTVGDSIGGIMEQVGNLSGALSGFFEEESAGYKAFATVQALISTYLAAVNVMAATAKMGPIAMGISMAATIAAGLAAVAKIQGFATGGIVSGSSFTGDRVPVMVNSGEMILNSGQQAKLFEIANGGGYGVGQVEFKVRGSELVGVLNNYGRKINSYS